MNRSVIGGDFEMPRLSLGSVDCASSLTKGLEGIWTASGRSAFAQILKDLKKYGVEHVHLPAYLCDSLLQPVRAVGMQHSFYPVDTDLIAQVDPPSGAAVLLIHYFGWINPATKQLRSAAGSSFTLIEDACQALLSGWNAPEEATQRVFLSPRKFGPTPLSGWCNLGVEPEPPTTGIEAQAWKSVTARLAKGAYLADQDSPIDDLIEDFYLNSLKEVETYLDANAGQAGVPEISLRIMSGLDWDDIAAKRRANWLTLNEALEGKIEPLTSKLPADVVPLGYVVKLANRDSVRAKLSGQRIFCPVHWPLPLEVGPEFTDAHTLSQSCLTLPIDQRYGPEDMHRLARTLTDAI
jgi:hypothetical protein